MTTSKKADEEKLPLPLSVLIYAGVAALLGLPFFGKGFILTVDLIYTPTMPFPTELSASYPFNFLVALISRVLSAEVTEKLLLVGALFLAGWGMHRLIERFIRAENASKALQNLHAAAPYFGGVLYILNPFVYSRFMAGQLSVLLGYVLLPFFITSLITFFTTPTKKHGVFAGLWLLGISIVSIHSLLIAVVIGGLITALYIYRNRKVSGWLKRVATLMGLTAIGWLLASSYWLIPLLFRSGRTATAIQSFDAADVTAFATNGQGVGILGNVLGLHGFWADAKNLYLLPQDVFQWWIIPIVLLWILVIIGILYAWRRQRGWTIVFLCFIILGAVLASGPTAPVFGPFNQFLIDYVPFFRGYREPQKFVVLIVLGYAYFGSWGVVPIGRLMTRTRDVAQSAIVAGVLCLIPLGLAPLMPLAFHNQLRPHSYPVDWQAIHERLEAENKPDGKVLFLPWHMYMRFTFAERVIANPAPAFFGPEIVSSNNPELAGAKSNVQSSPAQIALETGLLERLKKGDQSVVSELAKLHINYILLAKEQDYKKYEALDKLQGIELLQQTEGLKLYKVGSSKPANEEN